MKYLLPTILCIFIFQFILYADEGSFNPCYSSQYSKHFSEETGTIFFGCNWDGDSNNVIEVDPFTLTQLNEYEFVGVIQSVYVINNGLSLLVLLAGSDQNKETEDGLLLQISTLDGFEENRLSFSTDILRSALDSCEQYLYISHGLTGDSGYYISKIDVDTFEKVGEDIVPNHYVKHMALSNDDSKLYYFTAIPFERPKPDYSIYYKIYNLNTNGSSEMIPGNPVEIQYAPISLMSGNDERLFITCGDPDIDYESYIVIINTLNDNCTTLTFPDIGFDFMSIDKINNKIYCKVKHQDYSQFGYLIFRSTNQVCQIDLDDNYSTQFFTLGEEKLLSVLAVPSSDPEYECRIFATEYNGPMIHYLDIPR